MNRRFILAGAAALAVSPAALAQQQGAAEARTAEQWRRGIAGPAQVTFAESRIALQKGTNAMVKQFAGFETEETTAILAVLKELGTAPTPIDAATQGTIDQLNAVPQGPGFDQAYTAAMIENHRTLLAFTESYLQASSASTDMAERHGRHLAMLSLATIKEHLALTQRLSDSIKG